MFHNFHLIQEGLNFGDLIFLVILFFECQLCKMSHNFKSHKFSSITYSLFFGCLPCGNVAKFLRFSLTTHSTTFFKAFYTNKLLVKIINYESDIHSIWTIILQLEMCCLLHKSMILYSLFTTFTQLLFCGEFSSFCQKYFWKRNILSQIPFFSYKHLPKKFTIANHMNS